LRDEKGAGKSASDGTGIFEGKAIGYAEKKCSPKRARANSYTYVEEIEESCASFTF